MSTDKYGMVLAVEVRKAEGPRYVADDWADLTEGDRIGAEQCDNCGNTTYAVIMHGGAWYARCVHDPDGVYADDPTSGCGWEYGIHWHDEAEVVFP